MTNLLSGNFWLRLDNAAKLYPAVKDKELTTVFRITAELYKPVRIQKLIEALKTVEARFPYFKVRLKTGFFWYYLEYNDHSLIIEPDITMPCRTFGKDELMLRVLVKGNRINVEFSHIITDGAGAFEFLKTLLISYLDKCRLEQAEESQIVEPKPQISEDEFEDAYNRYFKKIKSPVLKLPGAFHLPFSLKSKPGFRLITAIIPLDIIIEKAKEQGVSLTDYLVAVYMFSLQEIYEQLSPFNKRKVNKIIRIQVPINLRRIFPTGTMRNFSLFVQPGIDLRLGKYTFEEITKTVYHQISLETDKKLINKTISRNVGGEKNFLVRGMPLFFKSMMLSRLYARGAKLHSGVLTNYGKAVFPSPYGEQIKKFIFIAPPPNKYLKNNCGVVGYNNELVFSFGNITDSRELEKQFLTFFTKQGIPVRIVN